MKTTTLKRPLAVILAVILIAMLLPAGSAFADSTDGCFYLMATTESKMIISPVRVDYSEGMSIRDALIASGYDFEGIDDAGGFISAIEGYYASFSLFYDGGEFVLENNASDITAIAFVEGSEFYSEETISAIVLMGQYKEMTNNVHNYPDAKKVYESALDDMRKPDKETAKKIYDSLSKAIKDYENIMGGEKYSVTFDVKKGSASVDGASVSLKDAYGNETVPDTNTFSVVAGEYSFVVSDNGYNRAEGKVTVSGEMSVEVNLPETDWFGDIRIYNEDYRNVSDATAYAYEQDKSAHTAKYFIPDTAGRNEIYLNAIQGDVPDSEKTLIYGVYTYDENTERKSGWNTAALLPAVVAEGTEPRTIMLEARYDNGSYTQIQSYTLEFARIPTLEKLEVLEGNTQILKGFSPAKYEYDVSTLSESLTVNYKTTGKNYEVTVDGTSSKIIDLTGKDSHKAEITVKTGDIKNTYTLNITKVSSATVTLSPESGVTAELLNENGSKVAETASNTYRLIAGETYTYIATKDTYFHTKETFTARDGMNIAVKTPEVKSSLKDFAAYSGSNSSTRKKYLTDKEFGKDTHEYVMSVSDMFSTIYAQATAENGYEVYAKYTQQSATSRLTHGAENATLIDKTVSTSESARIIKNVVAKAGYSQKLTISLEKVSGDVTYYQEYLFAVKRELNLDSLLPTDDGVLFMNQGNTQKVSYDYNVKDYYIFLPAGTENISFTGKFPNETDNTDICGGYYAMIGETKYEDLSAITVDIDPLKEKEDIVITVCHADGLSIAGVYTIHITQQQPVEVTFVTNPSDAIVYIKNNITGKRIPETAGKYSLNPGTEYTYTVTRNGYVGNKNEKYVAPLENSTVNITLAKARDSQLKIYDSWWSSFRADKLNNGIIAGKTPREAEEAVMYWATKIGDGFDKNACGCPIIVDGYLYTYAGTTIYKVDTVSGEILATGQMDHSSSFAVNPPTYADGMIFVGLAEGCVQAFSAETLESLWMYRDELGGQPNCTIYYHDGYIYTGFWKGENIEANYVCLSVTDEDPSNNKEGKIPTWTYTSKGGFYWAGAYVNDNFAIIGTDDGEGGYITGKARVVTFSTKTGEVIDEMTMPHVGDIRSTIVYDKDNDEYYFTSKGGYFYGIKVASDGKINDESLRWIRLSNGKDISTAPPMSTSSPAVYNQRAYVGVSGTSQFGPYTGHNITVLDLKNWEIAYTVPTQGYPQTSGIVSTAYEETEGKVYVYFIDNYTPGKLRVIADKPNQTKPETLIIETYSSGGKDYEAEVGDVLFTPDGEQAQYAICSPIVDEYGTIYFKNDSAYLMAIGSTIEKLEITSLPTKTNYNEGEIFDPTGMSVQAIYTNGLKRDVTKYITFSSQPLTMDDTTFQIRYEKVMYGDKDGVAGSEYTAPIAFVQLRVEGSIKAEMCDIDGDGTVTAKDLSKLISDYGKGTEECDLNGDGYVDSSDLSGLLSNYGIVVTQ